MRAPAMFVIPGLALLGCSLVTSLDGLSSGGTSRTDPPTTTPVDATTAPLDATTPNDADVDRDSAGDGAGDGAPAFCDGSAQTLYVHGRTGHDTLGEGSCTRPFRSITRGMKELRVLGWTALRIGGATPPVIYAAEITGEEALLHVDGNGWVLTGQSVDGVIIQGALGTPKCGNAGPCTVWLDGNRAELHTLTVTGTTNSDTYGKLSSADTTRTQNRTGIQNYGALTSTRDIISDSYDGIDSEACV